MNVDDIVEQLILFLGFSKQEKLSVVEGIKFFSPIPHDIGSIRGQPPEKNLLFCLTIAAVEDYLQPYLDSLDCTDSDHYRKISAILVVLKLMLELSEQELRKGGDLGDLWTRYGLGLPEWDALSLLSEATEFLHEDGKGLDWNSFFEVFVPDSGSLKYK